MEFLEGIKPREYQKKIFETCVEKNCLVVLPTGLGKTLIAVMLSIERLQKFPGEKVVFLAPTKPLVEQHLNTFKKYLPELFAESEMFTGKINANQRKKIWQNADIIFSTPQCIANDLKKRLYDLSEVCLLIEDEAHRCVRNYDYTYVAKKYQEQATNKRIVGLTASPGSDVSKIKEICKNLSIEEVELRSRDSEDVKQYLQELEFEKIIVEFPPELMEIRHLLTKLYDHYLDELRNRKLLFGPPTKKNIIELQKKISGLISRNNNNFNLLLGASACAQAIKIQHAIELLETQTLKSFNNYLKKLFEQAAKHQSKGVERLVAKPEFTYVYARTNELIAKRFEHPKIMVLNEIINGQISNDNKTKSIVFTQYRDTAQDIAKNLNEIKGIKAKVFVGQARKTTGKTTTGLSQKEQRKIIEEFSSGEINILVATSIGEEGLDIPEVNSVIFYEPVPSAIRAIQRAGRTARLMKGKLIILITKQTRDETFYYVSKGKEKRMHSSINTVKEDLKNGIKQDSQKTLK